MYGAMLAGVDAVFMGAGIPAEEAVEMKKLAQGQPASLRLEVDTSAAPPGTRDLLYELNPRDLFDASPVLRCPDFYPIVSSDLLARILAKKLPRDCIAGWVIEGPTAGGHNAPPRGKEYDQEQNPIYNDRDVVDLAAVAALGYPFYLAGGYSTPDKLREALAAGAAGIQVGSLFSLADESGYPSADKRRLIEGIHRKEVSVRTDGRASPTGFPFKVIVNEHGSPDKEGSQRQRVCDLGYLQTGVIDERGRLQGRCPAEPVDTYVRKGGKQEDTDRRACLCNGLLANIGLGHRRPSGAEPQLFTAGDGLVDLPLGSATDPRYSAADVIDYLYGRT
jgi:NAD(P)H-dependent flavin oxidoreductase YrpB (nitropropane dioxygenase family)